MTLASSPPHVVGTISPALALLNICSPGTRVSADWIALLRETLKQPLRSRGSTVLTLGDVLQCDIQAAPYALSVFLTPVATRPATSWCDRMKRAVLRTSFQEGVQQYLKTLRLRLELSATGMS